MSKREERLKQEHADRQVVKHLKFNEDKFYNDQTVPHFLAGRIYEIKGLDQYHRWLKRGGIDVKPEDYKKQVEAEKAAAAEAAAAAKAKAEPPKQTVDAGQKAVEGDDKKSQDDSKPEVKSAAATASKKA